MISYWEREYYKYDVGIVGGGFTALNLAISLKIKKPNLEIAIFEKDVWPKGASTRNAGFACFGSLSELISDKNSLGRDEMLSVVEKRYKGIELLKSRLAKYDTDLENLGGYEILDSERQHHLQQLEIINQDLKGIFNKDVFEVKNESIKEFGFDQNWCKDLIFNSYEGQIHPGKAHKGLWKLASKLGVLLFRGVEIKSYQSNSSSVDLLDSMDNKINVGSAIFCNNAWANDLLKDEDIKPGRGLVMITKEMDLKFNGCFHFDEGYFYFRNVGKRFLIGGGRNVDFESEESFKDEINEKIKSAILEKSKLILNSNQFEIDTFWTGIMGLGPNKTPLIKKVNNKTWAAVRLSGMGVALSAQIAEDLSENIIDEL
jgi:glycine/D-amino acid oxidase-like deaminating enzyme